MSDTGAESETSLDALVAQQEAALATLDDDLERFRARRRIVDQAVLAYIVVLSFVAILVTLTVATITKDWSEWEMPATFILGAITSALLPVVTLVIGYYFGKDSESR